MPETDLTVLVVWEPVIVTDRYPPTTRVLSRISDRRASQFWDQGRLLSGAIAKAERLEPDAIVWDFVAIYPAGVLWQDEFPAGAFVAAPVVDAVDGLRQRLRAEVERKTSEFEHGRSVACVSASSLRDVVPCRAFGG